MTTKSLNKNLHSARTAKTDEFYTQLVDGNKRTGAYAFLWFLKKAGILNLSNLTPPTLTALTLFVADSNSRDKDKVIGLILMLLKK